MFYVSECESVYTSWRVDADLLVELEVGEWELDCLLDLLLLDVHAADVVVRHLRLLLHQLYIQHNTTTA
jgi:hypothetical protein